jgi:hypothetical protein
MLKFFIVTILVVLNAILLRQAFYSSKVSCYSTESHVPEEHRVNR